MGELRWNPLLRTYTIVASNRQNRPNLPKNWCPFCPENGKVPKDFTVHKYDNDFPCMSTSPGILGNTSDSFFKAKESYGKCEVILYSPDHHTSLSKLSVEHISELIQLWKSRFEVLSKDPKIQYIFPFENRGEAVGVTMHHPHGQIYAYPFVPLKLQVELNSCRDFYQENGECLFCQMNQAEKVAERRILMENKAYISYLPYFTDYPFGIFIVSKEHVGSFADFNDDQIRDLAAMLKYLIGAFDTLYDKAFPYMMCIHQTPVNAPDYEDAATYYHFHIEFYPPWRADNVIKYYASSEMGAWAAANTLNVEDSILLLRKALMRYQEKVGGSWQ